MRDQILERFNDNVVRVRSLVQLYTGLRAPRQGRRPMHSADILRGATVLLHAALEEVFRATAAWRFPSLGEQVLNEVPLVGAQDGSRAEKFLLGRLAAHRAKTVQQVLEESVSAYLNYFNVNNTTEIASFLRKVGVDPVPLQQHFAALDSMIRRRHHIVHQADRNDRPGRGQQRAQSLSAEQVREWAANTEQFVLSFLRAVPDGLL